MSNLRTLKPFQKGPDSRRNTKGRPIGSYSAVSSFTAALLKEIDREVIVGGKRKTITDLLIRKLVQKALNGNIRAIKYIFEKTDGKPIAQKPEKEINLITSAKEERRSVLSIKAIDDFLKGHPEIDINKLLGK